MSGDVKNRENVRPSHYPASWSVQFESAGPLQISPILPTPLTGADDGYYREPYWAERYYGPNPGTREYPVGFRTHVGGPALKVALRKDQDVPITLRDGTVIYADVFSAANTPSDAKLPTILSWSTYGKTTPKDVLLYKRYFRNVPADLVSGFAQVEGPDPAYWSQYGYAVMNVDQRGVNQSGGDIHWWGRVSSYDAHDVIQWISQQSWSNGKVGLSGVSYYGIQQWYTASSNPPSALAAIAPRAHWHDTFRQWLRVGGIAGTVLAKDISKTVMGQNRRERMDLMAEGQPLMNEYWEDKAPKVENIHIPVYQVAGPPQYSSATFPFLPEGAKWLRFAPSYHLEDYYTESALATERRFFDRYLKGIDNGWERETSRVRVEVTERGTGSPVVKVRHANSWPVENTLYKKLYLDLASSQLADTIPSQEQVVRYEGSTGKTLLTYTFATETEVTGFLKAKLWVKAEGLTQDMDLFAVAFKIPAGAAPAGLGAGPSATSNVAPGGPPIVVGSGQLRVSLRELDGQRSRDWIPVHSLKEHQFLARDEVVPVEFSMKATALLFKAGDRLRLEIGGNAAAPAMGPMGMPTDLANKGMHVILSGGARDTFLQIPLPPT